MPMIRLPCPRSKLRLVSEETRLRSRLTIFHPLQRISAAAASRQHAWIVGASASESKWIGHLQRGNR